MKSLEKFWQQRSQKFGSQIEGVLLKSVPLQINTYLHRWMLERICSEVKEKDNIQILDIGCGYGRLSEELLKSFPKIKMFGIDIAQKYVDLYNQHLAPRGKAVKGDICQLPFKDNYFEMVFIVTTLMYLADNAQQRQALAEIYRVLKPGGSFVIIERNPLGYSIFNLGGLVPLLRGEKYSEIPAVSFNPTTISQLVSGFNLRIVQKRGMPLFTVFFYPALMSAIINENLGNLFLKLIKVLDKWIGNFVSPSLYIAYNGVKGEN